MSASGSAGGGSMSWPDDPADAKKAPTAKPRTITIAVVLMALGAAISGLLTFTVVQGYRAFKAEPLEKVREDIRKALVEAKKPATAKNITDQISGYESFLITLLVVFGLAVVVWVVMAIMVNKGFGWTRWAATGLAVAYLLFVMTSPGILNYAVIATVLIGLATVGLLWTGTSRAWLTSNSPVKPAKA